MIIFDSDRDSGDDHNDVGRYSEDVDDDYIGVDCKDDHHLLSSFLHLYPIQSNPIHLIDLM